MAHSFRSVQQLFGTLLFLPGITDITRPVVHFKFALNVLACERELFEKAGLADLQKYQSWTNSTGEILDAAMAPPCRDGIQFVAANRLGGVRQSKSSRIDTGYVLCREANRDSRGGINNKFTNQNDPTFLLLFLPGITA